MTVPMMTSSNGTPTITNQARPVSSRSAITMPPIAVMGAASMSVQVICTSIWVCCTSLVMRVMSDGAPKVATSRAEKSVTRSNRSRRTSRPNFMATFEPQYTAVIDSAICTNESTSITLPVLQM